ncbi:MAG: carbohydrate-binding protein [Desulfotomaculales bacterium]
MYVSKGKNYLDDRVDVFPSPSVKDRDTTIKYNGLLAKSGADRVFIHYGFDGWRTRPRPKCGASQMGLSPYTFPCTVPVKLTFVSKIALITGTITAVGTGRATSGIKTKINGVWGHAQACPFDF